jgi:hypothetical protein
MKNLNDIIDSIIDNSIKNYDGSYELNSTLSTSPNCHFEELISMGELVDRLSIVNFKLYRLKDEVMNKQND